jgi:YegS/Rv2252/BmrU family lipid kinase
VSTAAVIVNASSGKGCAQDFDRELEARFAAQGIYASVLLVRTGDEIVQAAKEAVQSGSRCVVAGGGDGTVSAVASQLAGTEAALGVLPMGTLNHFAKDTGIPLDIDEAIAAIARGREIDVDVGEVNGRLFINNSSLGLYPDIVLDREHQRRRLGRGKWMALLSASLHAARRYPVLTLGMDVDGRALHRRSSFVFVGNNAYKMAGFEIGERARLDEGLLSLYVTQRTGRFGLLRLALRALFGRIEQASDFDAFTAARVEIATRKRSVRVAVDGEVLRMRTPIEYRIRPRALRVMVPAHPPAAPTR